MPFFENDDVTIWDKTKTVLAYVLVIVLAFGTSIASGFVDNPF